MLDRPTCTMAAVLKSGAKAIPAIKEYYAVGEGATKNFPFLMHLAICVTIGLTGSLTFKVRIWCTHFSEEHPLCCSLVTSLVTGHPATCLLQRRNCSSLSCCRHGIGMRRGTSHSTMPTSQRRSPRRQRRGSSISWPS